MNFSIRTRLTFWYVTLLTVSLLAFGMIFSYTLFKMFMNKVDTQISSVANMMVHTVIKPSGKLFFPKDFDIILGKFFGIRTSGNYIQVLDGQGRVVARSSNLEEMSLPVSAEAFAQARQGNTTYEVVRNAGKHPIRVVTRPVTFMDKGLVAIVQVGSSLEGMDEIFHSIAYILFLGIVASVVVASVVGWFLAQKSLKPVAEITAMAKRIEAENLNERIAIKGPQDEIGKLASTINEMIGRLEKSFKQIKQFTADASHELKTPLTVLKGEMEIALRAKDNPALMREALVSSLEEIDRMSSIVRNLLDLAKIDIEREGGAKTLVRLDKVISDRCDHLRKASLDSGVELNILRISPVNIIGDSLRIGQLVSNLIDNALKYTPQGGKVDVSLGEEAGFAVFKVRDSGIGISKEHIPYVFDRFYRVDKARSRDAGGAGLGLSICKEIIDSLEGSIEVESELDKGTLFTVKIPSVSVSA